MPKLRLKLLKNGQIQVLTRELGIPVDERKRLVEDLAELTGSEVAEERHEDGVEEHERLEEHHSKSPGRPSQPATGTTPCGPLRRRAPTSSSRALRLYLVRSPMPC